MNRNLRLGIFVIAGLLLLIGSLYMIGSKRNLFNDTITVNAAFRNVNGLMEGNNVRFSGIDVGTVSKIEITSDTVIKVEMMIDKSVSKFISSNALASIGTDGLMGNKIVNIVSFDGTTRRLGEGSILGSVKPIDMDDALRTLTKTNDNLQYITNDVKSIAQRFNSKNTLWSILLDSNVAKNLKLSISNISATAQNSANFTQNLNSTMLDIKNGKGSLGKLLSDTSLAGKINEAVTNFNESGKNAVNLTNNLNTISANAKNGKGSVGELLTDTTTTYKLNSAISSLDKGAQGFSENMEALKHNFLFRKYFRKQAKAKNKK
ncbi:MAG: MlaD family protein [Bacteroidia bacterium]